MTSEGWSRSCCRGAWSRSASSRSLYGCAGNRGCCVPRHKAIAKGDVLRLKRARPINAFGSLGVAGNLDQFGFNQYLSCGFVEFVDERVHGILFFVGGNHNYLAGARVRYNAAALVGERGLNRVHHVRRAGVFELNDAGRERQWRHGVFGGDAGNLGLAIFTELQTVVVEQGHEGLPGGDIFPTDGKGGFGFDLSILVRLAITDFRIDQVIDSRLPGQIFNGGGNRNVLELDQRYARRSWRLRVGGAGAGGCIAGGHSAGGYTAGGRTGRLRSADHGCRRRSGGAGASGFIGGGHSTGGYTAGGRTGRLRSADHGCPRRIGGAGVGGFIGGGHSTGGYTAGGRTGRLRSADRGCRRRIGGAGVGGFIGGGHSTGGYTAGGRTGRLRSADRGCRRRIGGAGVGGFIGGGHSTGGY